MTLGKLTEDLTAIAQEPYGLADLQRDYPGVIFTLPLDPANLVEYRVVEIIDTPPPEYDPLTQNLTRLASTFSDGAWRANWQVSEASPEEQDARYNAQANWPQFYNGLLISNAFMRIRAGAGEVTQINAAYTDCSAALVLAVQGFVNVAAIQACFDNLLAVLADPFELTQGQKDELQGLLQACKLDRLLEFNW